jgi:DnaJ-class molecular chaperone
MHGGNPGGPGGPKVVFQAFHNGVPIHQQHNMHGNVHGARVVQVPPPETIIKTVSLTLEQSYNGCNIPLDIDRHIPDNGIVRIERETLHVQIPKGVLQGDTIILNDSGNMNEAGIKGDVRIIINILQHSIFKVDGLDLHIEKTISLKDALCGFNFEIHHLSGKIFQLSNKPGNIIKPGSIKTIPNLGLEKNGETGSIKIKFQLDFPETLTEEQIQTLSRGL